MKIHFLKPLLLTLLLTACGEPKTVDSENPEPLASTTLTSEAIDRIFILNGIDQNFSLVTDLQEPKSKSVSYAMAPGSDKDRAACVAPNHVVRHGDYLYVTCSGSHEIHLMDARTLKTVRIIKLRDGSNPWSTVIANDDLAFSAGNISNEIFLFNPRLNLGANERVKTSIDLKKLPFASDPGEKNLPRPEGLALVDKTLYVAITNLNVNYVSAGPGYIAAIDIRTGAVQDLIKTRGRNTQAVYQGPSSDTRRLLYIANSGSFQASGYAGDGSIDIYDIDKRRFVHSIPLPGAPANLSFAPDGIAYVTNGKEGIVFAFDMRTFKRLPDIDLKHVQCSDDKTSNPPIARLSYISSLLVDKTSLYATEFNSNCLIVVDRASRKVIRSLKTGAGPQYMIPI